MSPFVALLALSSWGAAAEPAHNGLLSELNTSGAIPVVILSLAAATFISEDLTCIAAGLLIREGALSPIVGISGCTLGIFMGDLGLWVIGWLAGGAARNVHWVAKRFPHKKAEEASAWFDRYGWSAIFISRFVPGTRFVTYIGAGLVGREVGRFMLWAFLASLVWTPSLVMLSAWLGDAVFEPIQAWLGSGVWATVVTLLLLVVLLRTGYLLATPCGRFRLLAKISRLWRWEFWPSALFYVPVVGWIGCLALRYRGLTVFAAANPSIPDGGFIGESKCQILDQLDARWVAAYACLPAGASYDTFERLRSDRSWDYPLVLKPDASQRGAGFKLARTAEDARSYFSQPRRATVVQRYHPGPFEAGIFYLRLPGEPGQIFSLTDKQFPYLTGDGSSTLQSLIWHHPRYRMQGDTFLKRFAGRAKEVLGEGETLRLAIAGNHCQGTLFRDGEHLKSEALRARLDEIFCPAPGICYGRLDVMYESPDSLRAGENFVVIEMNGVTSESTNVYDPSFSLLQAYAIWFRQWSWAYRLGAANIANGARAPGITKLLCELWRFYRTRGKPETAD